MPEPPRPCLLYHFVHLDSLPGILASGGLLSTNKLKRQGIRPARDIADKKIQRKRARRQVPLGGSLHDYIPFYFATRSPMMLNLGTQWSNDPKDDRHPHDLVYLVSSAERVAQMGLPFTFTLKHAVTRPNTFRTDLGALSEIDWPLMNARIWKNTEADNDRQRRRQAEFLVRDRVPLAAILGYGTYDAARSARVAALVDEHGAAIQGKAMRKWYY